MRIIAFLSLIILIFFACARDSKIYPFEIFKQEQKLISDVINFNKEYKNPSQIIIIDSLILILDHGDSLLLSVVDINNGVELTKLCPIGNGVLEFIPPIEMYHNRKYNTIDIYERSLCRLTQMPLSHILDSKNNIESRLLFDKRTGRTLKYDDSLYIGVGSFENRYAIFDTNGQIIANKYEYPNFTIQKIRDELNFFAYQNNLMLNENCDKLVTASIFCDNLEFFEINKESLIRIKTYQFIKGDFVDKSNSNGLILHPASTNKIGFLGIFTRNDNVYCLYSGRTINDFGRKAAFKGQNILVFDWKGNPLKRFVLDIDIQCFTIDQNENFIYAITNSKMPSIIKFKI